MLVAGGRRGRGVNPVLWVAAIAAGATALVYGIPLVHFTYPLPGAAVFASALAAMSALAISILFAMRYQRCRSRTDLLVAALFGSVTLIEGVLPLVAETVAGTEDITFWSKVLARSVVGLGLCITAWLPDRVVGPRSKVPTVVVTNSVVVAAIAVGWTLAIVADLPATVDDATNPRAVLARTTGVLTFRLLGALLLVAGSVGFVRRARRLADPVYDWLACGAVVMATARFHDYLYPTLHNDWVTTGDILRVLAFWLILFGLLDEIARMWRRRDQEARAAERRALAAELHDGLAQELAFLTTQSALAQSDPSDGERIVRIRAAAERALRETRLHIADYAQSDPVDLDLVLAEIGEDVEADYGCPVVLDLAPVRVCARTAHELQRVAREALTNAARHGHPHQIAVHLDSGDGHVRMSIVDDGSGILDPEGAARFTFGLTAMRERAERLGGQCSIISVPRSGTRVAIEVPER